MASQWLSGKDPLAHTGDTGDGGFNPWAGKIHWKRNWKPFQYPCLENPMDRGAWWTTVHGVAKSQA